MEEINLSSPWDLIRVLIKRVPFGLTAVLLIVLSPFAAAQVQTVSRSINGRPDTDIQIGVYVNVKPDCTSRRLQPELDKVEIAEMSGQRVLYRLVLHSLGVGHNHGVCGHVVISGIHQVL